MGISCRFYRLDVCESLYRLPLQKVKRNVNRNFLPWLCHVSFGALSTGYLSSRFGRKPSLIASGVIYIIGSAIQCVVGLGSSPEVGLKLLYFSRFFAGIGVGMNSALVPYYVSECTPRTIRGRCTGMVQLANNIGIMLSCESIFSCKVRSCTSAGGLILISIVWVNYSASKDISPGEMQWRLPFIVQ
jgi:MFS family permease